MSAFYLARNETRAALQLFSSSQIELKLTPGQRRFHSLRRACSRVSARGISAKP